MHKIFFSLLLILLITTTAIAAGIRPIGGFATSNVCSSMSSSSPNILINDGFSSNLLFQGVNGVVSNGALWQLDVPGPVTGSTLTQSAVLGSISGINGTGSFSLAGLPFTNFWTTGYTGLDFALDPVLWMGSVGNWINYPLPGWNNIQSPDFPVLYGTGYWLTYDPLNKLAPTFGSPYGGYIEMFVLPDISQGYQRFVGALGTSFLQEVVNQDYYQLKTPNGTLQFGSGAYGGFSLTTNNGLRIYNNSVGTWISGPSLNIGLSNIMSSSLGTPLNLDTQYGGYINIGTNAIAGSGSGNVNIGSGNSGSGAKISLNSPVTSNLSGVIFTFMTGGYVGTDNGLHMGSSITTSSVGIYNNSTGTLNPGFAEDYGPVTLTNGCATITLQYPFPTNHYNCTFNYLTWNTAIGFPTFTFTTNQFTVCSRSSTGVINTTDANTITGTCTGY